MKKVRIALMGLGNVGRGVWMILNSNKEEIMNSIGFSLAQAKKNNVFDVVWATREGIESFQRQSMITHILKRAIRNREFEVFYQPIYSTRDNSFLAAEALIRLKDEKLGFISPDEFVPIAEKNGLILEIGDIVFEKVCGALDKKNLYKNKTSAQYQNENEFIIPDVNNTRPEIMVYVNGILGE